MENNKQLSVDDLLVSLSENLNEYIYDKRLTSNKMAIQAGVSYPMIREIQTGAVGNIGMNKLINVANAIGLKVEIRFSKLK